MKSLEASSFALVYFFTLYLIGDSCEVSYYSVQEVNVSVGEVADMSFCRPNDTSECFRYYRVTKNWNKVIFTLNGGSDKANCKAGESFCERSRFYKYNASRLLLSINETKSNDEGSYEVQAKFKSVCRDYFVNTTLHVIHLKVDENSTTSSTSVMSTRVSDPTNGSSPSTSPTTSSAANFLRTFPMGFLGCFGALLMVPVFVNLNMKEEFVS
ncbi:unnamed protein product [Porites evermanni]|uniref:Uncharacterized protein n=1 Tax=Porites evermanni TaxID=104178 RepID=A0ABN8SD96_9CNID|nr:unnamed protein product [Porites evermanni]